MVSDRVQRQIDRLLDEAEVAIATSDWATVGDCARNVLRLDPENSDALSYLAASERDPDRGGGTSSPHAQDPAEQANTLSTEPPSTAAPAPEAERRQLTVMFCDLQGSTALSQQLDPEELRDVIRGYQEVCAGAVSRFEGHIAKYLGDGLLVYFGYPQAHEDDPQRAVRGGLAILDDMEALNSRLKSDKGLELVVRIGIHTGLVVAGEMGGGDTIEELAIVGETPNIAARIEGAANPNSVVVSNITANLIQGFFLFEALGPHELRGISEPVELYRVIEESGAQTRFEVAAAVQLTPLVGRDQEVGLLLDRWEQAQEGLGQVVLLSGEAGIGKSRLIEALTERLAGSPHTQRWLRCSAYHQNSAFHPVLEYLEGLLGFEREDSTEEKLGKLESALAKVNFPLAEAMPLLSGLLSIPLTERFPALAIGPEWQRDRTLELLVSLLLDSAEYQPVFIVVEDLHWADPSTLAVLDLLIDQAPTLNVLTLLSFRPEFTPPWGSRAYATPILLNRLTRRLATDMVDRLTGGKTLPEEIISQVASKSDGVPLFVEELIHMVVESGLVRVVDNHYELTAPLPPLAIPSTLQDSLTARLDRLGDAREVVQMGAVLGREFTYELMKAVSPLEPETLSSHLKRLVDTEFLYQRGPTLDATYIFKHALIQDAAYQSLLHSRRQQYHQQTAQVLEDEFAGIVEIQPELLAYHFAQAGITVRAVDYWLKAGQRALTTYAFEEAVGFFTQGLMAKGLDIDGSIGAEDEAGAALLFGLARAQSASGGAGAFAGGAGAFANLSRAFDYYEEAGNVALAVAVAEFPIAPPPARIPGMDQLLARALTLVPAGSHDEGRLLSRYGGVLGLANGDYEGGQEAMERAIGIARREGDVPLEVQTLAYSADLYGEHLRWQESVKIGLRAIDLATGDETTYSQVMSRLWTVVSLLHLGDLDSARAHRVALLNLMERRSTPRLLAGLSAVPISFLSFVEGDWKSCREYTDRGLERIPSNPQLLGIRVLLEFETGEFADAETYLDRLAESLRRPGNQVFSTGPGSLALAAIVRQSGVIGHLELAESVAMSLLALQSVTPILAIYAKAALALLALQKGDKPAAAEHYAYLEMQRGTMLWAVTTVDHLLGLLSQTIGNIGQALNHFEDALAFCRKAGYRPELAWTCYDYADALRERNDEGDRAKAIQLLDESLAISSELGMRPLMERVLSRREMLNA